jgi:hypothetical protein
VPGDFVNEGWSFETLESGDAKGGCPLAFLGSEFIVKELSSNDHQSLLRISQSYFEHVCNGDSLLSAIFLHFEDLATGRIFFVMRNVVGSGPFLAMYDLKGCNDDKTLELFGSRVKSASTLISHAGRWCGYFGSQYWYAYREFEAGKWAASKADLPVTESQRDDVIRRMRRDTEWLTRHHLMDYSLIVGIKSRPSGSAPPARLGQLPLARRCADGSEVVMCVGIIDFLQTWNLKKIAANAIKCMECNKATIPPKAYASRFCDYFEERFISTAKGCEAAELRASSPEIAMGEDVAPQTSDSEDLQQEELALSCKTMDLTISQGGALLQRRPDAAVIGVCVS